MRHYTGQELERLRREHPLFEFWVVYPAVGGAIWCARPKGLERPVFNADSPDDLEEKIAQAGRERP